MGDHGQPQGSMGLGADQGQCRPVQCGVKGEQPEPPTPAFRLAAAAAPQDGQDDPSRQPEFREEPAVFQGMRHHVQQAQADHEGQSQPVHQDSRLAPEPGHLGECGPDAQGQDGSDDQHEGKHGGQLTRLEFDCCFIAIATLLRLGSCADRLQDVSRPGKSDSRLFSPW